MGSAAGWSPSGLGSRHASSSGGPRPAGLLYDLASAIASAGCNIGLVLIGTEAHKAIDVFYVTAEARKLDAAGQAALRDRLVATCAQ